MNPQSPNLLTVGNLPLDLILDLVVSKQNYMRLVCRSVCKRFRKRVDHATRNPGSFFTYLSLVQYDAGHVIGWMIKDRLIPTWILFNIQIVAASRSCTHVFARILTDACTCDKKEGACKCPSGLNKQALAYATHMGNLEILQLYKNYNPSFFYSLATCVLVLAKDNHHDHIVSWICHVADLDPSQEHRCNLCKDIVVISSMLLGAMPIPMKRLFRVYTFHETNEHGSRTIKDNR